MDSKKIKEMLAGCSIRKLKKDQLLILFLTGVLLVVIALPSGGGKTGAHSDDPDSAGRNAPADSSGEDQMDYIRYLEQKLEEVISQMEGAGDVTVMVTLQSSSEKVVEKDASSGQENVTEADSQGGTRSTVSKNLEETTVYASGEDAEGSPYVSKELSPRIEGVLVVAEGGGRAEIKQDITEAVEALFGIESHKIRIMKKQEP